MEALLVEIFDFIWLFAAHRARIQEHRDQYASGAYAPLRDSSPSLDIILDCCFAAAAFKDSKLIHHNSYTKNARYL